MLMVCNWICYLVDPVPVIEVLRLVISYSTEREIQTGRLWTLPTYSVQRSTNVAGRSFRCTIQGHSEALLSIMQWGVHTFFLVYSFKWLYTNKVSQMHVDYIYMNMHWTIPLYVTYVYKYGCLGGYYFAIYWRILLTHRCTTPDPYAIGILTVLISAPLLPIFYY